MGWLTTLLALAMVLSPALGQMHRAVHAGATHNAAHGPHWGHAAATTALLTQAQVVRSAADCVSSSSDRSGCASDLSWVHALFAGHGPAEWPFDQPFYLILNLAIGGAWGGQQGVDLAGLPVRFLVDYVRVYREQPPAPAGPP